MPVGIYLRVSTDEQRERQSIETQRQFAEHYCALHNLSVFRVYADDGVSGTVPLDRRAEGGQILADARLRKFDQLLIYRLDRLGRDTRLILNGVAELEKLGVRVRSMSEEFDTGTASGRLMLTLLSGFAAHERDVIRERSVAGTQRVAEAGAWLGGIVPYGYRKIGEKRKAQIVGSDQPIPGVEMSERDVIRLVFKMSAVEKKSCRVIATRLNELRVPCAYVRDDRLILRGKRRQKTAGIWRPGRVRGLITNKTYMGVHEFGKRSSNKRAIISRAVPAIITEAVWKKAQANLKAHLLFGMRNARNRYLLRGLIKCALCGLTYVGIAANRPNGKRAFYYKCNGTHSALIYAKLQHRCTAKSICGDLLEEQVWSDIQTFLRNPSAVLAQLRSRLTSASEGAEKTQQQIRRLGGLVFRKAEERTRVVGLFRRGRLTDAQLDAQMDEIAKEEAMLQTQMSELGACVAGADSIDANVESAEALLTKLRKRLDEPVSWEQKRYLIETLIAGIRVETFDKDGVRQTKVTVTYRFSQPDQAMPLLLPQTYASNRVRIPIQPVTVGDHLRRRRLSLKILQRDIARQLGVTAACIFNWEGNRSTPHLRYMPAIIRFLGYNPLPDVTSLADKLVRHRTLFGMTQTNAAAQLGVDAGTLSRWERGEGEPEGVCAPSVDRFLSSGTVRLRHGG